MKRSRCLEIVLDALEKTVFTKLSVSALIIRFSFVELTGYEKETSLRPKWKQDKPSRNLPVVQ